MYMQKKLQQIIINSPSFDFPISWKKKKSVQMGIMSTQFMLLNFLLLHIPMKLVLQPPASSIILLSTSHRCVLSVCASYLSDLEEFCYYHGDGDG